jgi:hypothetical protein
LDGVDAAKLGVPLTDAARTTGWIAPAEDPNAPHAGIAACRTTTLTGAVELGVLTMNGIVQYYTADSSGVQTPSGIHVGSTEAEVRAAYPGRLTEREAIYDPTEGKWLVYTSSTDNHRLVFMLHAGRVIMMRTGIDPYAFAPEGCA